MFVRLLPDHDRERLRQLVGRREGWLMLAEPGQVVALLIGQAILDEVVLPGDDIAPRTS